MNSHKDKLEILNARLLLYYKAEKAILAGSSYEAEGLNLTRADLKTVQTMIAKLENEIARYSPPLRKRYRVVRPGW